jgi:UDP-2-acetamido-2,6-beta-L-arabino-hexul-4-ose reductase
LFEILRNKDLENAQFGHLLLSVAHAGQSRGGHYHKKKHEWFCVIKGSSVLQVVDIRTGEKKEISMSESNRVLVKLYPYCKHTITNVGTEDVILLAYTDLPFDPKDPDTFYD